MASSDVSGEKRKNTQRPYVGTGQMNNELSNPCIKEQDLSRFCLEDNNYDKEPCEIYFLNYRNCRGFWNTIIRERRAAGLMPYLPFPEDRAEIIAQRKGKKK